MFPALSARLRPVLIALALQLGLGILAPATAHAAAPLQAAEARKASEGRPTPQRRGEASSRRKGSAVQLRRPAGEIKARRSGSDRQAEARRPGRKASVSRAAPAPRAKGGPRVLAAASPSTAAVLSHPLKLSTQLGESSAPASTGGTVQHAAAVDTLHDRSAASLAALHPPAASLPEFNLQALKSNAALVIDPATQEVLLAKNAEAVLPIASLTKLMTSLVVLEAGQPLDEMLSISTDDIDTEKGSSSRLQPGTQLSRGEMLHLALMSSENRAANALGRHYPGGLPAFVRAMNAKATVLGMADTRYVEPTGLSSQNRSSARDLALLVRATAEHPLLRSLSTSPEHRVAVGKRELQYRNTNGLVRNPAWDVVLQKTGYISEAGRCLVMQARLAGRDLILVFLDSAGKYSRIGDAERVRRWVESSSRPSPLKRTGQASEGRRLTS